MQWLIDLIIEAIGIPPVFIDRGDPAAYDWDQTTLTMDAAWHELDVSGVVPANASAILFNVWFEDGLIAKQLKLRKSGHTNPVNEDEISQSVAAVYVRHNLIVATSPNQKIEYNLSTVVDWCLVTVRGWWL